MIVSKIWMSFIKLKITAYNYNIFKVIKYNFIIKIYNRSHRYNFTSQFVFWDQMTRIMLYYILVL